MVTARFHDDTPDVDGLYADLAAADLQPLWTQPGLLTRTPDRLRPHIWRWKTLRDLAERSGDLVGIDRGGDRRVLSLSHPDLGGLPFATHTLWGAVQFLGGGELAPAHRHTPAALRFVLEGSGVWTLVNGDAVHMAPGDLILTPSWTWHEHHNPGTEPMIWFDGLDLPLVQSLDAIFFEPGSEEPTGYEPALASRSEQLYSGAGLLPASEQADVEEPASGRSSRLLAYRWPSVDAALSRLIETTGQPAACVRYADPVTGRDIMPTVRAEMHRVLAGHRTCNGPDRRQRNLGRLPRIGRDRDRWAPLPLDSRRHVRHAVMGGGRSRGRRRRRPVPLLRRAGARGAWPRPHRESTAAAGRADGRRRVTAA